MNQENLFKIEFMLTKDIEIIFYDYYDAFDENDGKQFMNDSFCFQKTYLDKIIQYIFDFTLSSNGILAVSSNELCNEYIGNIFEDNTEWIFQQYHSWLKTDFNICFLISRHIVNEKSIQENWLSS